MKQFCRVNRDHLVYLFMGLAIRKREGIDNKCYNNDTGVSQAQVLQLEK